MTSLNDFLQIISLTDEFTQEAVDLLSQTSLASQECSAIAQMEPAAIARVIIGSLGLVDEQRRTALPLANNLLAVLAEQGGYTKATSPAPAPTIPTEIKIVQERTVEQMSIKELINTVLAKGDLASEAWRRLKDHPDVLQAQRKSSGLGWVVNGALDVDRTIKYIDLMLDPYTVKQIPDRNKGERLLSLAEALGVEDRLYLSPLTGRALRGPDERGIHWPTQLEPETHKAALYALKVGSKFHPGDSFDGAQRLLNGGGDWSLMMSEYWAALDANDPVAKSIEIYVQPQQAQAQQQAQRQAPPFPPSQTEDDYRRMLLQAARPTLSRSDSGADIKGIYTRLSVSGSGSDFHNVIILQSLSISGGGCDGRVIFAPRASYSVSGSGCDIDDKYCRTWQETYEKAAELGLV